MSKLKRLVLLEVLCPFGSDTAQIVAQAYYDEPERPRFRGDTYTFEPYDTDRFQRIGITQYTEHILSKGFTVSPRLTLCEDCPDESSVSRAAKGMKAIRRAEEKQRETHGWPSSFAECVRRFALAIKADGIVCRMAEPNEFTGERDRTGNLGEIERLVDALLAEHAERHRIDLHEHAQQSATGTTTGRLATMREGVPA